MRWQSTEFILKGIYLGLLVFVGLQLQATGWWQDIGRVAACTFGGLALFLSGAAVHKLIDGYRIRGRLVPFLLFLVLENPALVYAGVLLGMAGGAYWIWNEHPTEDAQQQLFWALAGGAVLGYGFNSLRQTQTKFRVWMGLIMAVCLVVAATAALKEDPTLVPPEHRLMAGTLLLLGLPLFYLLTLCGYAEESEIEFAALCTGLCLGLGLIADRLSAMAAGSPTAGSSQSIALGAPLLLYFVYTWRIMPGLRVFKYVLRGVGYANAGYWRQALAALNRALQLDPRNQMAREQMFSIHRNMDLNQVANDPETLAQVNFEFCIERVGWLLLHSPPSAEQLGEAQRLLDLVSSQRPALQPRCDYWRAVAYLHERRYDEAAASLEAVLTASGGPAENPQRWVVLMQAWQLAMLLHPRMVERVGLTIIGQPGRRMEAIAAVERYLTQTGAKAQADPAAPKPQPRTLLQKLTQKVQEQIPQAPVDAGAWNLKRLLYNDLQGADYRTACVDGKPPEFFDHAYARELGLAHLQQDDTWKRGEEYLRMAAHGLPAEGVRLFVQLAQAYEKAGNIDALYENYELAKAAGRAAGPKTLKTEDRQTYYAVVKALAEDAINRGDLDAALENYHLYTEYERAGVETYRSLARLYEQKKDVWAALRCCEQGLQYDKTDKDLLARKDSYYYSVTVEQMKERWESVKNWFDIPYCIQKARWLLDRQGDLDLLDWASHLLDLAQAVQPESLAVKVLRARLLRRRGEVEKAVALLEEVRTGKPEKFPSTEEAEAWYGCCRQLGELYLNDNPQRAIECLMDFLKSTKSGADTYYKLGVAHENLGDHVKAAKWYEQVTAYESHPLAPDAHDRLYRLRQGAQQT